MLKIAVISDVHANLPALKAVLEDIDKNGTDQIYCLGDLTDAAPWHNETIELLRNRHIPVIMGNHDERIAYDHPVLPLSKHSPEEQAARLAAINFTRETITPDNSRFLANLPRSIYLDFDGYSLLLTHGSPRSNEEYLYVQHDEEDLLTVLETHRADVLIVGHTHLSYIRSLQQGRKMVINTGSVGRTKEEDRMATYLQLKVNRSATGSPEIYFSPVIKKVPYPLEENSEGYCE